MITLARIVASKWFAGPLCVAPLLFLSWDYFQALVQLEQGPGSSIQRISDANRTFTDTTVTDVEYADFSFTVSDEDFHEYTGGTFRKAEGNSTKNEENEENFSFTVSDEEFDAATETL